MFFLLFLALQEVRGCSYPGQCGRVPVLFIYKAVAPVYLTEVPSSFVRCLETARSLPAAGLYTYPVYTCWNELVKYKDSQVLAHLPATTPCSYNALPQAGPIAYGQSSSWAGSYGNPSLLSGVSASASASASAGGLTVSSGSSSSANTSSSTTLGSYSYKPELTLTGGSSSASTSSVGSGGYHGGYQTSSSDGSTLTALQTTTNPASTGYSHYLNRPASAESVGSGIYYTGYNIPSSTITGPVSSTSLTSHPPGYYTAFYKPSGASPTSSGGQYGQLNTYYYQPVSPNVAGSVSRPSTATGTHHTGTGNYYTVYHKPTGSVFVGTTTGTNPIGGTYYTSSASTSTGGTSGSLPSFSGSLSNVHQTSGLPSSIGNPNKPHSETNFTSVHTTADSKPWWLISGIFASSLGSSSTLGFPSQVLIPANETSSEISGSLLGSFGNITSGTSASSTVVGSSTGTISETGTSSSSATTSNNYAGNTEDSISLAGVSSGSVFSSSSSESGTILTSNSSSYLSNATSPVSTTSSSLSSTEGSLGSTNGLSSSTLSEVGTIYSSGSNSESSVETVSNTATNPGSSTGSVAMPSLETGQFTSQQNTVGSFSNSTSLVDTSSSSIPSSGINLNTSTNGLSQTGGDSSSGVSPATATYLTNPSEPGLISMNSASSSLFPNNVPETTAPTAIMLTSTIANNVPWWISSEVPGMSSIFGSVTGTGSVSSTSSSNIFSTLDTNSGSTENISGASQTNAGTSTAGSNILTSEGTKPQTGTTTNTGPWWLLGGLFGGNGAGSSVSSGSNVGSSTDNIAGSGGSFPVYTGSGSSTYTNGSSTAGSVQSGIGSSSVSSSESGGLSGPWWLSGLLSGSGGGSPTFNSTGSNIGSTVFSKPGNNTVFPSESDSQQNVQSSGQSTAGTFGGPSIFNSGIEGLTSSLGGSSIPSWLLSSMGQTQTAGAASTASNFASANGSGMSVLPGVPNLHLQFQGGQTEIPSLSGSSASSSATATSYSGSIMNSTSFGGYNKPDRPWWQSGGLTGLGSVPYYLKFSEKLIENAQTDDASQPVSNTVNSTKPITNTQSTV